MRQIFFHCLVAEKYFHILIDKPVNTGDQPKSILTSFNPSWVSPPPSFPSLFPDLISTCQSVEMVCIAPKFREHIFQILISKELDLLLADAISALATSTKLFTFILLLSLFTTHCLFAVTWLQAEVNFNLKFYFENILILPCWKTLCYWRV